jgi:hypothetical protein
MIIVPLFLLGVLGLVRQANRFRWLISVLFYGLTMVFLWLVFPWDVVSIWYKKIIPLLYLAAVALAYHRIREPEKSPPAWEPWLNLGINGLMIVFMSGLIWKSLQGYAVPVGVIELVSPLRDGTFVVGHGGSSPFINGHSKVRPQNHALDIQGLNRWGRRSEPFTDLSNLENYAIFEKPIHAPCDGRVLLAVDGFEDLIPPAADRKNLAGNHLLIACRGVEIVLAHLKQGSIRVSAGQAVDTQMILAQVGNSGNTSEPHLHIHAERGGEPATILNGQAVPISIDGRYLVRGDTF